MKQGLILRQMFIARNNMTALGMFSRRDFASPTKKIGPNDHLQDAKLEARKYGIKRRFYDHLPTIARQLPEGQ